MLVGGIPIDGAKLTVLVANGLVDKNGNLRHEWSFRRRNIKTCQDPHP
jgi:hypothetical protein